MAPESIVATDRVSEPKVMTISGEESRDWIDALLDALELGATDYLVKPIDQLELVEILVQAQDRTRRWRKALLGTWRNTQASEPVTAS